jgi:hypothetical protein
MIHEDHSPNTVGARLVRINEDFLHSEGPAGDNRGPGVEMLQQLANILRSTGRMVSVAYLFRSTLATGIKRNDPVGLPKMLDLRLPDLCGHGPSWHEHKGRAGSGFQVVEFDPIT